MTARDVAKFGLLYLNKGRWGELQIVPEAWVNESFTKHVDLTQPGQPPSGYGYLRWIGAPDPRGNGKHDVYFARGRYGQYILIAPEHDMVVIILGVAQIGQEQIKPIKVFYDRILTAVKRQN